MATIDPLIWKLSLGSFFWNHVIGLPGNREDSSVCYCLSWTQKRFTFFLYLEKPWSLPCKNVMPRPSDCLSEEIKLENGANKPLEEGREKKERKKVFCLVYDPQSPVWEPIKRCFFHDERRKLLFCEWSYQVHRFFLQELVKKGWFGHLRVQSPINLCSVKYKAKISWITALNFLVQL